MTYELPPLPYDYNALEPYIDARTMEIHHTKHHAGYIAKLNALLEGRHRLLSLDLEAILADMTKVPEEIRQGVRNNGGGHLNHSLFWRIMGPHCGGEPGGELAEAIVNRFDTFTNFRSEFTIEALSRFGSGWAWLCVNNKGALDIFSTPNQDSPVMLGTTPILGLDVWEHAYYLKYQNRRPEYVEAWWNVVNWERVAELYSHALSLVTQGT